MFELNSLRLNTPFRDMVYAVFAYRHRTPEDRSVALYDQGNRIGTMFGVSVMLSVRYNAYIITSRNNDDNSVLLIADTQRADDTMAGLDFFLRDFQISEERPSYTAVLYQDGKQELLNAINMGGSRQVTATGQQEEDKPLQRGAYSLYN